MKRVFGIVFALCALTLCVVPVSAESAQEEILAAFSYDSTGAVAEDNIELLGYGDKDKGYNATTGDAELYASVDGTTYRKLEWTKDDYSGRGMQPAMTGGNNHPWKEGAYLEVQVSTRGYQNITFSAQLGATNKGPRDYQLQYSTDGVHFTDIGEVYSLSDNKSMEQAFDNVALPDDANDQSMLYIRMAVVGETLVNGTAGLYGSTSGETAINDIVVCAAPSGNAPDGISTTTWIVLGVGVAVAVAAAALTTALMSKKKAGNITK